MSKDETTIKISPLTKDEVEAAAGTAAPVPASGEAASTDREDCGGCCDASDNFVSAEAPAPAPYMDIDEAVDYAYQYAQVDQGKATVPYPCFEALVEGAQEYAYLSEEIPHQAINGREDAFDVTAALLRNTKENLRNKKIIKIQAFAAGLALAGVVAALGGYLGDRYRARKAAVATAACAVTAAIDAKLQLLAAGLQDVEVTGCAPVEAGGVGTWVCGAKQGDRVGVVPLVGYECGATGWTADGTDPVVR